MSCHILDLFNVSVQILHFQDCFQTFRLQKPNMKFEAQAAVLCKQKWRETCIERSCSCIPQHVCIPYLSIHTYPRRSLTHVTCWNGTLGRMQLTDSYEIQESDRHIENGYVIKILSHSTCITKWISCLDKLNLCPKVYRLHRMPEE